MQEFFVTVSSAFCEFGEIVEIFRFSSTSDLFCALKFSRFKEKLRKIVAATMAGKPADPVT